MKFTVRHEIKGRLRIHVCQDKMTCCQADILRNYLQMQNGIASVKVYHLTGDVVIKYSGTRASVIYVLQAFRYEKTPIPTEVLENHGRELNTTYKEKLISKIFFRYAGKLFVPKPIRAMYISLKAVKYICKGVKCLCRGKVEVPVLDAVAIGASVLRNDVDTAGSIMFLLGIGELLEEWTHKKSVDDLARTMSLNIGKVWLVQEGKEILVPVSSVTRGDRVIVHVGNVIPFDGIVDEGEAMVNQASLTGESTPVRKTEKSFVYAGTVVEEGELTVRVATTGGSSRYEKIVTMIEESEKLKSTLESKAEHLADQLVPYMLAGTGLIYLLTGNVAKTLSVLMVDFSCAMKLAMPISVLSAIREAGFRHITVKGGKFLEAMAEADTIVFDKTGTLTKAKPTVVKVVSFNGQSPDELLRIAACMEEHFPHSMANAVVSAAKEKKLYHEEMHSKVEYAVAHGISTTIEGRKTIIGSYHFVFEDEKCRIPEGKEELFGNLPLEYSRLYLAEEGMLAAVICISDPLKKEAKDVLTRLRQEGISRIVMMTGDSEQTAASIAKEVGITEFYAEVLPEEKAKFIEKAKRFGHKVIMVGDGINDSPALSAADVGIAISNGAELAREIADITIGSEDMYQIVLLRRLSSALMKRIQKNYRWIVGFNSVLILLGITGMIPPATSALFHNTSTLVISLKSMQKLLP